MRVALISGNFPPKMGGIATFSWDLAYHVAQHPTVEGVEVIAFGDFSKHVEPVNSKMAISYFPDQSILSKGITLLTAMRRVSRCDVFHAITLFPEGVWMTGWAKTMLRKPCFITLHGTDALSPDGSWKTRQAKSYALHHADRLITVSRSTDEKTRRKYQLSQERTTIIPYGTTPRPPISPEDLAHLRAQYGLGAEDFVALTVCRLIEGKGVGDVIRAMARIPNPHVKFLVAGDGPDREQFQALAKELRVDTRVIWAGRVPHEQISAYYQASQVFVLASFFQNNAGHIEGLPIALLEAQSYGLPVVTTQSGGNPETLEDGRSGFVVPERDVNLLADRILTLAQETQRYRDFSAHARQWAVARFGWDSCVAAHLKVYQGVNA